ncbi:hypothetical protein FOMG_17863 [Fusarium oxysporum f. sp. melonis 26406]|uniref:Alpha/beta hydrolase fold-3 domain-containing protein n=1 Tax=Fusarium oxysporum f. sp. melonis 26406 TaxID=1089452 RepID=W9Z2A0_FUSOX|nr:hypothetical protein FOMG_17863 [Fusarium oxysporum f. sp. melonis 26406]
MTALFCNYCVTPPSSPISRVQPYEISLFPMATQTVNPPTVDGYRDSDDEFSSDDQEFHVDERSGRSWPTKILHNVIQPIKPKLVEIGKVSSADPTRCKPSRGARKRCDVQENKVENIWTYDMTPKSSDGEKRSYARRILYFAGGGWQAPPSGQHWTFCAEMINLLQDTRLTLVSYPLAPKDPVQDAFPAICKTYNVLLKESSDLGERVIVAGDSSGGNIALCLVTWTMRDQDVRVVRPPSAILAITATTDLRHNHPDIKEVDKVDPILSESSINETAGAWAPGHSDVSQQNGTNAETTDRNEKLDWSADDPRVSPIHADLGVCIRNNVKIHGITASHDVLGPEAVEFRERCRKEGVDGEWLSWGNQMHCFPLAYKYGLKESKEGLEWIIEVLKKC